ncbi:hypothetical protein GTW20_14035 [Nocardiopsis alba]|uniref:Transmembrane protein n=1 Tax=Nocardiopsis alba TaxID=53437 RepID=A0A7K2ITV0_9ACTN|nr:hypothetical protein [Nocardiopsis sp. LDBS1602]MEC3893767.1 hypothetical protein [Nocardiopsis sp. LDBS1602]MYR33353.1 hypothetical protein [Nocardiopsis alba]
MATVVVFGVLLALGPWVRHPTPDFITETERNLEVELELGEEHLGELGIYGRSFSGACSFHRPSGTPGETQMRGAASVSYGAEEWNLVHILTVVEPGTHKLVCSNDETEFGVASMHVVETASTRQMLWGLTWVGLPLLGLIATVTLGVLTLLRDRREKAAVAAGR